MFRWTRFDYYGEADWPMRNGNFGIIDVCSFPKDHYYLCKGLWTDAPVVHILPHWSHAGKEGTRIPVVVYTNCDRVELFLNSSAAQPQPKGDRELNRDAKSAKNFQPFISHKKHKVTPPQ
jgi:beta-galactosidase